jgi:hypothetical protein
MDSLKLHHYPTSLLLARGVEFSIDLHRTPTHIAEPNPSNG